MICYWKTRFYLHDSNFVIDLLCACVCVWCNEFWFVSVFWNNTSKIVHMNTQIHFNWHQIVRNFSRNCYLLIVSIVSSRCLIRCVCAFFGLHVLTDFYVQWPMISLADYRGRSANLQTQLEFLAPKMERSFEFVDNHLREFVSYCE